MHSSVINDPSYVEDFLLTHRTFLNSAKVMDHLLKLMNNAKTMDTAKQRVTRVLLLWVRRNVLKQKVRMSNLFRINKSLEDIVCNYIDVFRYIIISPTSKLIL